MKPGPGDSDFEQWQSAMKMVARLPDGVPHEFRNTVRIYLFINYDYLQLSCPMPVQSRSPPTTTRNHLTHPKIHSPQ